jgi:SecA-like ATPase subunit of protein translocation complex
MSVWAISCDQRVGMVVELVAEVERLRAGLSGQADLRPGARLAVDRIRSGDESLAAVAVVMAHGLDAIRRVGGSSPSAWVVRAAGAAALGLVASVDDDQRLAVLTVAAYVLGARADGVHVPTVDDRATPRAVGFMAPVLGALGGDVAAITATTGPAERRQIYAGAIVVGSYLEIAWDYLRDTLDHNGSTIVQRGLGGLLVSDMDTIAVDRAMAPVIITAPDPKRPGELPEELAFATRLERGGDYGRVPGRPDILFMPATLRMIKQAVGWGEVATIRAVDAALQVERAVQRKDRLIDPEERIKVADITVQGFIRSYDLVGGVSAADGRSAAALTDIYGLPILDVPAPRRRARQAQRPDTTYLTTERIIDEQRSELYGVRAAVLGSLDSGIDGVPAAISTLAEYGQGDPVSADGLTEATNEAVAVALLCAFVRHILSKEWNAHLRRLRFLQSHLYSLTPDVAGAAESFARDAAALFTAARREAYRFFCYMVESESLRRKSMA